MRKCQNCRSANIKTAVSTGKCEACGLATWLSKEDPRYGEIANEWAAREIEVGEWLVKLLAQNGPQAIPFSLKGFDTTALWCLRAEGGGVHFLPRAASEPVDDAAIRGGRFFKRNRSLLLHLQQVTTMAHAANPVDSE